MLWEGQGRQECNINYYNCKVPRLVTKMLLKWCLEPVGSTLSVYFMMFCPCQAEYYVPNGCTTVSSPDTYIVHVLIYNVH